MSSTAALPQLSSEQIATYRRDGFTVVRGLLGPEEADHWRRRLMEESARQGERDGFRGGEIFRQQVNLWTEAEDLLGIACHPAITACATQLVGKPLRLWHDHLLVKPPRNTAPTQFHQDQPYWPHRDGPDPISAWIALVDVPARRGCMSFIPGSHARTDLRAQNLHDPRSLFELCPELEYAPKVTLPLRAGDVTFHHGRCAHMANANDTDEERVALATIYMERGTRYDASRPHVVTDPLGLEDGELLQGSRFPDV